MSERYRLLEVLRQSEYSCVLRMLDEISGREVICRRTWIQEESLALHRQKQEAILLSLCRETGIPALLDTFEQDGFLYLIRECCPGQPLDVLLQQKLPRRIRKRIFNRLVCLLKAVHEQGYVYLDLKPDNVLADEKGNVFLFDFDSIVPAGSTGMVISNGLALPPEAGTGQPLEFSADQWGLGQIYRLLFGADRISRRLLQKDPARRYRSLRQLQCDLQPVLSSRTRYGLLVLMSAFLAGSFTSASAFWKEEAPDTPAELAASLQQPDLEEAVQKERFYDLLLQPQTPLLLAENPQMTAVFLQKALDLEDPQLCRLLLQRLPEEEPGAFLPLLIRLASGLPVESEEVSILLDGLSELQQDAGACSLLVRSLFLQQMLLQPDQMQQLLDCLSGMPLHKDLAEHAASYLLWQQAESGKRLQWPENLLETLEDDPDTAGFAELYHKSRGQNTDG